MDTPSLDLKYFDKEILTPLNYYDETFFEDFSMLLHVHTSLEIMYCEDGSFSFDYAFENGSTKTARVDLTKGHFVFINAGCRHKMKINTPECRILNLEFKPQKRPPESGGLSSKLTLNAEELFSVNPSWEKIRSENKPFYLFFDRANVSSDMKGLIYELAARPENEEHAVMIRLLTVKLFTDIARCAYDKYVISSGIVYLKKALGYIRQNFQNKIKVSDLAKECGISSAYLQRLFKQEFNKNLLSVITEIRLDNVKRLLSTTDLNNTEIGRLSGFFNRQRLIDEFKKSEHCTPEVYRKEQKKKPIRLWTGVNAIDLETWKKK